MDRGLRIAPISDFIESELARLEGKQFEREHDKPAAPVSEFNDLFRSALDEVWSYAHTFQAPMMQVDDRRT